jgi:hypothetical protein
LETYNLYISGVTPSGKTTGTNVHGLILTVEPFCYREILIVNKVINSQGAQVDEEFTKFSYKGQIYN